MELPFVSIFLKRGALENKIFWFIHTENEVNSEQEKVFSKQSLSNAPPEDLQKLIQMLFQKVEKVELSLQEKQQK